MRIIFTGQDILISLTFWEINYKIVCAMSDPDDLEQVRSGKKTVSNLLGELKQRETTARQVPPYSNVPGIKHLNLGESISAEEARRRRHPAGNIRTRLPVGWKTAGSVVEPDK
jgi:hypothetical protein